MEEYAGSTKIETYVANAGVQSGVQSDPNSLDITEPRERYSEGASAGKEVA